MYEFDRVLGGGLTHESITLLGGDPGVGKSTLLLAVCDSIIMKNINFTILYVSGEESESQVAQRCKRLKFKNQNFFILHATALNDIKENIKKIKPKMLIIDSIQTTYSEELNSPAGSASQVREVTFEIMNLTKMQNLTTLVIGHITKDGAIAGPKMLEHMVDTVLYLEGEKENLNRVLRAKKNRFGSTSEIGIFELNNDGIKESNEINEIRYSSVDSFGTVTTCLYESGRSMFREIQSLVLENKNSTLKRVFQGVDYNRVLMLVAVLEKYCELPLAFNDIYINIIGSFKVQTRENDLAIQAALLSSLVKKKIDKDTIFIGEVGLTGEVRQTMPIEGRLKEMEKLGYKKLISAKSTYEKFNKDFNIEIVGINNISELMRIIY